MLTSKDGIDGAGRRGAESYTITAVTEILATLTSKRLTGDLDDDIIVLSDVGDGNVDDLDLCLDKEMANVSLSVRDRELFK